MIKDELAAIKLIAHAMRAEPNELGSITLQEIKDELTILSDNSSTPTVVDLHMSSDAHSELMDELTVDEDLQDEVRADEIQAMMGLEFFIDHKMAPGTWELRERD